ncbi:TIGR04282 family arsenosugar biosynthesis glycosyltransferase [Hyunsoonleella sp. 2307UL5-6]|uniref:TIGR04282 family arsenosugar biosynthesis glycosyltransferase n=1 Tax=Hyunsoonleella sp. 2307UL5-6 TaxID=3384768 RepID=UPI0039BCDDD7
MKQHKTAILIFANSAEKEAATKPFSSSKEIFEALNTQAIGIAKKSGLPYFLYSEKQQVGRTFGARFTNAIQSVYNKGFDAVITLGNDTPHLTTHHILKTVEKLNTHDIVLGPSTDGGFYIMGLKKSHFNVEAFLKLPWQTSKLNRSISRVEAKGKTHITYLEVLTDIDTISDIRKIIHSFTKPSTSIIKLLIKLVQLVTSYVSNKHITIPAIYQNYHFNKGSPICLS